MGALERSERYYKAYGEPMLCEKFPDLLPHLAIGVFGQGSENFGYDDEVSPDHDIDPGFYLFLNADDFRKYEFPLSRAYDALPDVFEGVPIIGKSVYENARHGVRETTAFFREFTGLSRLPQTNGEWLRLPDFRLACATNGRLFFDGKGEVTAIRAALLHEPEDVRLKKLSRHLALAAQSGQYNYARALAHREQGAAVLALAAFAQEICGAVHKLNFAYAPFYKWLFRSTKALTVLPGVGARCEALLTDPLNEKNKRQIEEIAALVIEELKKQALSDLPYDFLEPHAYEVQGHIADPEIRTMHVME